jgi:hypothetical protein
MMKRNQNLFFPYFSYSIFMQMLYVYVIFTLSTQYSIWNGKGVSKAIDSLLALPEVTSQGRK